MSRNALIKEETRFKLATLAGGVALVLAGAVVTSDAIAQIATTKHNLGSTGTVGNNKFDGTDEICVFCHTPHGADSSASAPLWNRVLGSATYTTYDSLGTATLDGKVAKVGSVSIACLSCHDGTQAMNVVVNAPGTGNYSKTGVTMAGNWTGPRVVTSGPNAGKILGLPDVVSLLGTDLTNDHPIGIQYAGGGYSSSSPTTRAASAGDPAFKAPSHNMINGKDVWWVETGGNATRNKEDMMLYGRPSADFAGGAGTEPSVECGSCHDPHSAANPTFLRTSNAQSAVCLACHIK